MKRKTVTYILIFIIGFIVISLYSILTSVILNWEKDGGVFVRVLLFVLIASGIHFMREENENSDYKDIHDENDKKF